jgi:hypothetical protein
MIHSALFRPSPGTITLSALIFTMIRLITFLTLPPVLHPHARGGGLFGAGYVVAWHGQCAEQAGACVRWAHGGPVFCGSKEGQEANMCICFSVFRVLGLVLISFSRMVQPR